MILNIITKVTFFNIVSFRRHNLLNTTAGPRQLSGKPLLKQILSGAFRPPFPGRRCRLHQKVNT